MIAILVEWDRTLMRAAGAVDWPAWIDRFFVWLTHPPYAHLWFAVLALAVAGWGGRRGRIALVLVAVAVAASDQIGGTLIKPWVDRLRPCFALPEVQLLLERQAHSPSFPSNHAANTFAAAVVLARWNRPVGRIALVVAALVGWSRIHVGVHYPGDVAAGAGLGALIGYLVSEFWVTAADRLGEYPGTRSRPEGTGGSRKEP